MYRGHSDDSAVSMANNVQEALIFRHLKRSQINNALVRKKAQQLAALKALRRSTELRRQLVRAKAASSSGDLAKEPNPSPPLDPSVKALIEKLTEIAELLPSRYRGDQARLDPTYYPPLDQQPKDLQRAAGYPVRHTEFNNIVGNESSLKAPLERAGSSAGPRGLPKGRKDAVIEDDGWGESLERSHFDEEGGTHQAEGDGSVSEDTARSGSPGDDMLLSSKEYMDPLDASMSQQLLELDSEVNSLIQDLDDKPVQAKEFDSNKVGAREKIAEEQAAEKKIADEKARKKEKKALLAQLKALAGGLQHRRPRWRWLAEGVANPEPDRILKGRRFWRAAVFLVIVFFVRPRREVLQRRARSKDRDTQDWNATLTIYFDRCQMWLLKTARVPVGNSLLKSSALNFRLNRLDGKGEPYGMVTKGGRKAGGGFVSDLIRKVTRGVRYESVALTLMRLKVHAKGILIGLTQEMPPSDIMTFFSYLAGDGNYFPEGFFFEEEAKVLSFDELGAVRKLAANTDRPDALEDTLYATHPSVDLQLELEADARAHHEGFFEAHNLKWPVATGPNLGKGGTAGNTATAATVTRPTDLRAAVLHGRESLPGKLRPVYRHDADGRWFDVSLVEMILTNYLMVRVLIPWILLYPRESGLIPSSGVKPSLLAHNCQVLASTVYLIMRVLRPELAPSNPETVKAVVEEEIALATKVAARDQESDDGRRGSSKNVGSDESEADSGDESNGDEAKSEPANEGTPTADSAATSGGSDESKKGEDKKKRAVRRREKRAAREPLRPRTVRQIMQQRRYVSISDKQLVLGLLPDAYFLPFAEQMRPWVLELAAEFDRWMQRVVAVVMGNVEGSSSETRQERAPDPPTGVQDD